MIELFTNNYSIRITIGWSIFMFMTVILSLSSSFFSVVLNSIIFFSKALSKIPPQANGPQDYMGKKKQVG